MTVESTPTVQLDVGMTMLIQIDTQNGHISTRGEVVYVSSHHFRVRCENRVSAGDIQPDQDVRISILGKQDVLPSMTKFVRVLEDQPRVIILRMPDAKWQHNRRAFFRGEMEYPIVLHCKDGTRINGKTIDMSGGGALIEMESKIELLKEIQSVICLDANDTICSEIQVVREDVRGGEGFSYGVKFLDINSRDQNRVCRLVIVAEFENRRSEMRDLTGRSAAR